MVTAISPAKARDPAANGARAFWTKRRLAVLAGVLFLAVFVKWMAAISGAPIAADDADTLRMAHNLVYHGVVSDESADPGETPRPTNYREPFPPAVLAAHIAALDAVAGPRDSAYFMKGEGARIIRQVNLLWGLIACASVFAAAAVLTGSAPVAILAAAVTGLAFETGAWLAEPAAAALLALFSFLAMMAARTGGPRYFGLAGLALGALILTKAAFLAVGLALFAVLAVWAATRGRLAWGGRRALLGALLFALGAAAVIAPWVARNYVYLGAAQVTQRAGSVLYFRAVKNQMTPVEYAGSFYAWAPSAFRPVVRALTGFGPQDLMRGGRLQRLNRRTSDFFADDVAAEKSASPEKATSFYYRARAERKQLIDAYSREGRRQPKIEADAELHKRALAMILGDPARHVAMTLPFLWRGAFYEAPLIFLFAVLALLWRRADLAAFVLPALAMIGFYALASHNITRYNDPVHPVMIAGLAIFGFLAWNRRANRRRDGQLGGRGP